MSAPLQHVLRVLEEDLELFHENFALQLVFLVDEVLKELDLDFGRKALDQARIHAVHVDRQLEDLLQMLAYIIKGLVH